MIERRKLLTMLAVPALVPVTSLMRLPPRRLLPINPSRYWVATHVLRDGHGDFIIRRYYSSLHRTLAAFDSYSSPASLMGAVKSDDLQYEDTPLHPHFSRDALDLSLMRNDRKGTLHYVATVATADHHGNSKIR